MPGNMVGEHNRTALHFLVVGKFSLKQGDQFQCCCKLSSPF